jgi:hypothetical protein
MRLALAHLWAWLRRVGRSLGGPGAGREPSPALDDRVGVAPSPPPHVHLTPPARFPADDIERMERRAVWLYNRALRKPMGSNGRHQDLLHAAELVAKAEYAREARAKLATPRRWRRRGKAA